MPSRREEKERLRQIREEAEKRESAEQRRKLYLGYGVAGILAGAVIVGIVLVVIGSSGGGASGNAHLVSQGVGLQTTTQDLDPDEREGTRTEPGPLANAGDLQRAARAADCTLHNPPEEGNTHLLPSQPTPKYKSDPPTSGNHDPVPLANGVYSSPIPNFRHALHTLEHGRIAILYQPDLPEAEQLKLKGVVDEDFRDVVMFPTEDMQWEVAAAAWGHYLGCEAYNDKVLDAIRAFRDSYRGRGPEPTTVQPG
ncbi:MAG: DUF3105 domain-containing protein [Solirubrobacterales bacterium]